MGDDNLDHEVCLGLGLGLGFTPKADNIVPSKINKRVFFLDLSIHQNRCDGVESSSRFKILEDDERQESMIDQSHDEDTNNNGCGRKKLRLTRDQTTLLEDSFRQHTTLNAVQKQALAEKLNLKPRQVEVWFQNRRARTKLKQTEVDCEFLKKNCERLSEENRRLKKELSELRSSMKMQNNNIPQPPPPVTFFQYQKSTTPPAEKIGGEIK